jgi:hypothetical protein
MAASTVWKGFDVAMFDRYTLRYVIEMGVYACFECRNCNKLAAIDTIALIDLYGSDTTIGELKGKARCRRCKSTEADVLLRRVSPYPEFKWWPRSPRSGR